MKSIPRVWRSTCNPWYELCLEGTPVYILKNKAEIEGEVFYIGEEEPYFCHCHQILRKIQDGIPYRQNDVNENYPSWDYKSHVIFEDTTFRRNAADMGGAVHLSNGEAIFRNCYFVDNFAATQGGHINTVAGSASVIIKGQPFPPNHEPVTTAKSEILCGVFHSCRKFGSTKSIQHNNGCQALW
ncbi:hypothetical protein OS493_022962 [Desmophyllum pertusum]|uniref:Uncharacterized protein n=1 Tax=Desmophyllum pertusum TaxID=174260 RepID=A0A9W9ZD11_9CNID|nr:hypothetical protein OS493_022962 [Desmophyllum pertusum]